MLRVCVSIVQSTTYLTFLVGNAHVESATIQMRKPMSEIMKINQVMEIYKLLVAKMESQVWTDVLAEDDIKLLKDVEIMTNNLIGQVYIFIDLLQQYNQLVEQSSIFAAVEEENKNDDMSNGPTQTLHDVAIGGMAAERRAQEKAERRAQEKPKKKTPFDVVQGKK